MLKNVHASQLNVLQSSRTAKARTSGLLNAKAAAACAVSCPVTVTTLIHQLAESLGNAVDAKDPHTLAHSEEVAVVTQTLALSMGLPPASADLIHVAGHLHDLGKIGVPDAVLRKPGKLAPDEWLLIKAHPSIGADILRPLDCLRDSGIMEMVLHHHERFDGQGYPHGLRGQSIPLGARIITLADSLSAMLQARPYRPPLEFDEAASEIERCSGSQFDPEVVKAFMGNKDKVRTLVHLYRTAMA
ncbi:HD-GYP domain-containing protein [Desulfocurvibacter africanus]|uniref:Metal dependent phosphohydrolase n=1 Tax=Desulfocurvibacter africanus subsp. africanus str. Walvis Bay TaxID=690850 RepID=F3YWC8_DESAF|nr:HD-GYP domain-containing protein [Desulfocurvibacter africanus]EGJ49314.1 metal dependent phosphohydrolase [Desulfocurvibacter africanus subsp. africanus str. Walvis Bay]